MFIIRKLKNLKLGNFISNFTYTGCMKDEEMIEMLTKQNQNVDEYDDSSSTEPSSKSKSKKNSKSSKSDSSRKNRN